MSPSDLSLVTPGKSSRLLAMRDKAVTANVLGQNQCIAEAPAKLRPELLLARQAIEQRLTEIMAKLPAGKARRLFKIRYGVELEQIKVLPLKRVFKLLEIQLPITQQQATVMKLLGDLNYNGELA